MLNGNISCDVLVVGGGVSGAVAAVASARSGVRTVLVEKENFLGGIGFSGMLSNICGLYLNGDAEPIETLNSGIVREIVGLLNKLSPQKKIKKTGKVFVLPYSRFDLRYVLNSLCLGEPDLTASLNTMVVSVVSKKGKIRAVALHHEGNRYTAFPKAVIDCTGNANVSVMAGVDFELSAPVDLQLSGYTIQVKGLSDQDETLSIKVPYCLAEAVNKNLLPPSLRFSTYTPGDFHDEGYCKFSINVDDNADSGLKAQEYALKAHQYLAERLPSFRTSYIADTSTGVIDREGRRSKGEYTLTEEDVLTGRKFRDGAVKNSWPIELWDKNRRTVYKYLEPGDYYEIPFRCLKVKNLENLLCAGRIISVSHEAYGSTRVMGTCMALGEQAGRVAAYYTKNGNYPDIDNS